MGDKILLPGRLAALDVVVQIVKVKEEWAAFLILDVRNRSILNKPSELPLAHRKIVGRFLSAKETPLQYCWSGHVNPRQSEFSFIRRNGERDHPAKPKLGQKTVQARVDRGRMMNSCEGISESAVGAPEGEGHKCRRAMKEGPCWSEA